MFINSLYICVHLNIYRSTLKKLNDLYTCQLMKLYNKFYRNWLPVYFERFLPEYGEFQHDLRNNSIRLPTIRREYGKINAKYQLHLRLREFDNLARPNLQPLIQINDDTLSQSFRSFSRYLKSQFISSYSFYCIHIYTYTLS